MNQFHIGLRTPEGVWVYNFIRNV